MKLLLGMFFFLGLVQYPLWLGKGSWTQVWDLKHCILIKNEANHAFLNRNGALESRLHNLRIDINSIEDHARNELGMLYKNEVFLQVVSSGIKMSNMNDR